MNQARLAATFSYECDINDWNHWILNPYRYWRDNVRETHIPAGINSSWYQDWFLETYNLKWSYEDLKIIITAEREEDWVRFQLEWM